MIATGGEGGTKGAKVVAVERRRGTSLVGIPNPTHNSYVLLAALMPDVRRGASPGGS